MSPRHRCDNCGVDRLFVQDAWRPFQLECKVCGHVLVQRRPRPPIVTVTFVEKSLPNGDR